MTQPSRSRADHLRRFADELDLIASRSETEAPVPPEQVDAIFAEHEAECLDLEAIEGETEAGRDRASRRA